MCIRDRGDTMAQGNPETFPKGNSNLNKTIRNVAVAGGTAGFILAGALSGCLLYTSRCV